MSLRARMSCVFRGHDLYIPQYPRHFDPIVCLRCGAEFPDYRTYMSTGSTE